MDYRLESLDSDSFERLVLVICKDLFGIGVVGYTPGKDGGKDASFEGTADNYPSKSSPWNGKFIVQAKHTANPIASCNDSSFKREIDKEIGNVKILFSNGKIDNYIVFTNRKYSGISGDNLVEKIILETGVKNVRIIGKSDLNSLLDQNKSIVKLFGLDKNIIPFDFSDEEIKSIILAFKGQLSEINSGLIAMGDKSKYDFSHIEKEEKNKKNGLGEEYYKQEILSNSLMDFDKIQMFLEDSRNETLKDYYYDIAVELNHIIIISRDKFDSFEEVFVYIYKYIADSSTVLLGGKRHIFTFLHFMYIECLIGKK